MEMLVFHEEGETDYPEKSSEQGVQKKKIFNPLLVIEILMKSTT